MLALSDEAGALGDVEDVEISPSARTAASRIVPEQMLTSAAVYGKIFV
jgi:hypothetical protein